MQRIAEIAQLVEHFTRNEGVVGSSPIFSLSGEMAVIRLQDCSHFPLYIKYAAGRASYILQTIFQAILAEMYKNPVNHAYCTQTKAYKKLKCKKCRSTHKTAERKGYIMKIKIVTMLLSLAVLGTAFTGCNEKEEEDNLELVWELESDKGRDTYV